MLRSFFRTYGKVFRIVDSVAAGGFTVAAIAFLLYLIVGRWGLDLSYIQNRWRFYIEAAGASLYYTTVSFAVGMLIGLLVGWARAARTRPLGKFLKDARALSDRRVPTDVLSLLGLAYHLFRFGLLYYLRRIGDAFVAIIRGTPLFVQIMFAAAVLLIRNPELNPLLLASIAALIALTVNTAGYQSEIFRAGFQTVHSGQVEAARAIGLSRSGAMRHVVLPQAVRLVIPPLTNEFIGLLKASSLISIVGILELTRFGQREAFNFFAVFESFALVTGIYLLLTVPLSKVVSAIERRYRIPGLGVEAAVTTRSGA